MDTRMCLHVTCLRTEVKATAFYHQTIVNGMIALLQYNICKSSDFLQFLIKRNAIYLMIIIQNYLDPLG